MRQDGDQGTLAFRNLPSLMYYGQLLKSSGEMFTGTVLVGSSPVELAVEVLSAYLSPNRVIGLGTTMDSLGFRAEVARWLGAPQANVRAFTGGEHGWGLVPLYSTIRVLGWSEVEFEAAMETAGFKPDLESFYVELAFARMEIRNFLENGQVISAYERLRTCSPGVAACLRPLVMDDSRQKRHLGVSQAFVETLQGFRAGKEVVMSAQVKRAWRQLALIEALPLGFPCIVGPWGVRDEVLVGLTEAEYSALIRTAEKMSEKTAYWREACPQVN